MWETLWNEIYNNLFIVFFFAGIFGFAGDFTGNTGRIYYNIQGMRRSIHDQTIC